MDKYTFHVSNTDVKQQLQQQFIQPCAILLSGLTSTCSCTSRLCHWMKRTLRNWGAPGGCGRPPRCRSHSRAWSVHSSSPLCLSLGCLTPTVWQYQKWLSSLHNAVNHRHGLKSYTPLTAAPVTSKKKKRPCLFCWQVFFSFLFFWLMPLWEKRSGCAFFIQFWKV